MAARFESFVWLISVVFRFLWACFPQTSYIHPDEFFQATEITAGDVFGFQHVRTWEFNETFPVRSVAFQYLLTGLPFYSLKIAFDRSSISSTLLIIAPRIVMTAFSLIIDLSTYLICVKLNVDPSPSLCLLGTSFVTLVFYTRSFSNTVESTLFALLLLLVISSVSNGNRLRTRWDRLRYFFMGTVVAAGIWNRPTFAVFACVPLIGWLSNVIAQKWITQAQVCFQEVKSLIFMASGAMVTSFILTMVDSYYFGYLKRGEFVLTPFNFLRYNLDTSSLKEHGLHPRFTHFIVNMPLLFGPLAFILLSVIACGILKKGWLKNVAVFLTGSKNAAKHKSKLDRGNQRAPFIWSVLLCSVLVPVALLSVIPHQEPRFIIPVLAPLVILFSKHVVGPSASRLTTIPWFGWNILGCLFFGVLHQGGLCSCLGYLQEYLSTGATQSTVNATYHLTFHHTYMPPQHLLAWHPSKRRHLVVHDLQGSSSEVLNKHLDLISRNKKEELDNIGAKDEVFVICPATVQFEHPNFVLIKQFSPHLTMEDPPDFNALFHPTHKKKVSCTNSYSGDKYQDPTSNRDRCEKETENRGVKSRFFNLEHIGSWIKSELSLNLYQFISNSVS